MIGLWDYFASSIKINTFIGFILHVFYKQISCKICQQNKQLINNSETQIALRLSNSSLNPKTELLIK